MPMYGGVIVTAEERARYLALDNPEPVPDSGDTDALLEQAIVKRPFRSDTAAQAAIENATGVLIAVSEHAAERSLGPEVVGPLEAVPDYVGVVTEDGTVLPERIGEHLEETGTVRALTGPLPFIGGES